jgi:dTDP-4-amino-4,6-dideoxygalactose transaminase
LTEVHQLKVSQIDLVRQYKTMKQDIDVAMGQVLESGSFILGRWVEEIEKSVAAVCGARYGIAVASGTDALDIALMACDLKAGDEVITSPFSFVSVAEVAIRMGAKPVLVDIDPKTFNSDAGAIAAAVTSRTKAIVPVHLYGQSVDMDPILETGRKKGIPVIEDMCQAIGARYKDRPVGSMGAASCISFYPTKNLGCYGDGGMLVTNDDILREKMAALRKHGQGDKYNYKYIGVNSRLDSIQAAILVAKVGNLPRWNEARRKIASLYDEMLRGLPVETPYVAPYAYHVYHQYTIRADRRDQLQAHLRERGIGTAIHYPRGIHLQDAYRHLGYKPGDLANCDEAALRVLSLPMFPELERAEIEYVARAIREFYE